MVRLNFLILGVLAIQVASVPSICGTEEECNQACADEWQDPGYKCERYSQKQQACEGCVVFRCMTKSQVQYRNPLNGKLACCPADHHWEFNKDVNKGKCCHNSKYLSVEPKSKTVDCCPAGDNPPHKLFVDPVTGDSSCCESSAIEYKEGKCIMAPPKPPPHDDRDPRKPGQPDQIPVPPAPQPPTPPADQCGHQVCPPDEYDMGVEYGKCYRLISVATGSPISMYRNEKSYTFGPRDPKDVTWHFRLCRSTTDCTPGGTIKADEKFVLNDVIGKPWDANPGPWFFCHGVHHYPCVEGKNAKEFNAKKYCTSEGCGLCISTDPDGLGGVCPGQLSLGSMTNPRNCMPFFFEEMPCLWPSPFQPQVQPPPVVKEAVSFATAEDAPEADDNGEFEFEFHDTDEL